MNVNELSDLIRFDAPVVGINIEAADMLLQQQSKIDELKADNFTLTQMISELTTIRGSSTLVPDDKLKEMRERLAHLEKMIVWYQDITMTGTNSQDYENGFWDAVNFVKQHQLGTEYGYN